MIYLRKTFVNTNGNEKRSRWKIINVREWIFVDSSDFFLAPILEDEITIKILKACGGEWGEKKLYEETEERFVTYKGIVVPQKLKERTVKTWFHLNKKAGINPYALCIKKTGWSFFVTCLADGMFAEEVLGGKRVASSGGIAVFVLPEFPSISYIQRKMLKWKKEILAESENIVILKGKGELKIKTAYIDDYILSFLKNFRFDRKTNTWIGKDVEAAVKLVKLDSFPSTKTYGRGLYYLCEIENVKKPVAYSPCFSALF